MAVCVGCGDSPRVPSNKVCADHVYVAKHCLELISHPHEDDTVLCDFELEWNLLLPRL